MIARWSKKKNENKNKERFVLFFAFRIHNRSGSAADGVPVSMVNHIINIVGALTS